MTESPSKSQAVHILSITVALLGCFALFITCIKLGWLTWPMARARTTEDWLILLYMQAVLAVMLMPPIIIYAQRNGASSHYIRPGSFQYSIKSIRIAIPCLVAATWILALGYVLTNPMKSQEASSLVIPILLVKAGIYTLTEEACYRGVLLPAFQRVVQPHWAILGQAILFTLFHFSIQPALIGRTPFMIAVFGLGIILGLLSQAYRGIGYAWMTHYPIGIMIEWTNRY